MHPLVNYITKILRKQGKKWGAFFDDDAQNKHLSRAELIQKYRSLEKYLKEALGEEMYKMTGDAPIMSRSESLAHQDYENYWLYESIGGEINLISGLPFFSSSLTWIERGTAQVYVIFDPMTDDLFSVSEGSGAQYNNKRIRFIENEHLDIVFANKMLPALEKAGVSVRIIGAIELEIAWLCSGKGQIGCYTKIDLSPGLRLMIKEAGGSCFEIPYEGTKLLLIGHTRNLIQFMDRAQFSKD